MSNFNNSNNRRRRRQGGNGRSLTIKRMKEGKTRRCNTVVVNPKEEGVITFCDLDVGEAFIKTNPTRRNNPCVYFKINEITAIHQSGRGITQLFDCNSQVIPIEIVETHILLPEDME